MKKYLSIILIFVLALSALALSSCELFSKSRTLSIGVYECVSDGSFTETVAAIVTEEDGTVVLCRLDRVTYSPTVDAYGKPVVTVPKTASELGGTEYEEIRRFENYATGKTVSELLTLVDGTDPEFTFSHKQDYISAIEKAEKNEYKTHFRSKNLECAVAMYLEPLADESSASFTLTGSFAAVVEAGGKIEGAIIDANEVVLTVAKGTDGTLAVTEKSSKGTKLEQGESYGMDDYNPYAIGDWYEQAGAYVETLPGIKTAGLGTELPENAAGCTIATDSYRAALAKAADKIK